MKKGAEHTDQLKRLNRIEGQVRGISKMIEEGRYCIDILTQMKAIKSAMASVESKIVEQHLNHCVTKALAGKNRSESEKMIEEIVGVLNSTRR